VRILIRLGNTTRNSLVLPGEASLSCRKGERREALQNLQFEVVGLHSLKFKLMTKDLRLKLVPEQLGQDFLAFYGIGSVNSGENSLRCKAVKLSAKYLSLLPDPARLFET